MSEAIVIACIGAIGVFVTVLGSIITVQLANSSNKKQQRIMDMRKIKLEYYHKFIEAWVRKYNYFICPDCEEAVEANLNFILEVNRLPLYASQEMVSLIEEIRKNKNNVDFSHLYEVLRKDLSSDGFTAFQNLQFSFTIPDAVIGTKNGRKEIYKNGQGTDGLIGR